MVKKKKRATKRRVVKRKKTVKRRKPRENKALLTEALRDLSKEINVLKKDRSKLNRQIDTIDRSMVGAQEKEAKLRDTISRLVAKESSLNKRKGSTQSKILRLKEKLAKVSKIKQDIREI